MNWTNEKPVKAGWYWWRDSHRNVSMRYLTPFIIKCTDMPDNCQWSGPIPEPED